MPAPVETKTATGETERDEFAIWWQQYRQPVSPDSSSYPDFFRGAWGSRLDETRGYLLNAEKLRNAGFDSIMLAIDVVFDPATGEAKSLGDDVFIFYLQALKKAGFRIILVPNPMHPNLDMGQGYEWEGPDPEARYHRSHELIKKLDAVVIKWAGIAEQYQVDGFIPTNEPHKLVRDYHDASRWLQEILPRIREVYSGRVIAIDTMYDLGQGKSIPFPYDYSGYDMIYGGPPCGWKEIEHFEEMLQGYIARGDEYAAQYNLQGSGLYEWGGYTGGVWFEPIPDFQVLDQQQVQKIIEITVRQAEGKVVASFPRISLGWVDFDTAAFETLAGWYRGMGTCATPLEDRKWTYDELIEIETRLGGADYQHIFTLASEH